MIKQKINPLEHNTYNKLYKVYGVDFRTFKAWIEPISSQLKCGDRDRNKLFVREVNVITAFLGLPYLDEDEDNQIFKGIDFTQHNTAKALSALYKMDRRTFSKRIALVRNNVGNNGNVFRGKMFPREVREIISLMGEPPISRPVKKNTQQPVSKPEPATQHNKKSGKTALGFITRLYGKMKRLY